MIKKRKKKTLKPPKGFKYDEFGELKPIQKTTKLRNALQQSELQQIRAELINRLQDHARNEILAVEDRKTFREIELCFLTDEQRQKINIFRTRLQQLANDIADEIEDLFVQMLQLKLAPKSKRKKLVKKKRKQ